MSVYRLNPKPSDQFPSPVDKELMDDTRVVKMPVKCTLLNNLLLSIISCTKSQFTRVRVHSRLCNPIKGFETRNQGSKYFTPIILTDGVSQQHSKFSLLYTLRETYEGPLYTELCN